MYKLGQILAHFRMNKRSSLKTPKLLFVFDLFPPLMFTLSQHGRKNDFSLFVLLEFQRLMMLNSIMNSEAALSLQIFNFLSDGETFLKVWRKHALLFFSGIWRTPRRLWRPCSGLRWPPSRVTSRPCTCRTRPSSSPPSWRARRGTPTAPRPRKPRSWWSTGCLCLSRVQTWKCRRG